jgi:hypothetical protein
MSVIATNITRNSHPARGPYSTIENELLLYLHLFRLFGIIFIMMSLTKMKKYRRRRNIETSIFLASIDTFLQNPGIDSIEYLVSISAHPYFSIILK